MELAGGFEIDLRSIVEWGDETAFFQSPSFGVPVEMNGIELPKETS